MNKKEALEIVRKNYPHVGFSGSEFETALRELVPEFEESEDERIRKAIGAAICGTTAETVLEANGVKLVDALSYLEKQKEQKPNIELIQKSWYLEGYYDGKYNNEPKWLIQTGKEGPRYEENPKYGTQQPAEWSEDFEDNIRNLLHDKLTGHSEDGSMSWAISIDDKTLKDIVNGIWFYIGKEALKYPNKELSQPEWSEEDELEHDYLCKLLRETWDKVDKGSCVDDAITWLENLPERIYPHSWKPSEEQVSILGKVFAGCKLNTSERDSMVDLFYHLKDMI